MLLLMAFRFNYMLHLPTQTLAVSVADLVCPWLSGGKEIERHLKKIIKSLLSLSPAIGDFLRQSGRTEFKILIGGGVIFLKPISWNNHLRVTTFRNPPPQEHHSKHINSIQKLTHISLFQKTILGSALPLVTLNPVFQIKMSA
ncbi:hypothetical protein B0J11DRAFT_248402 [Dendryphion nanum]|uniref:Uncharacterized protein n=1 Tax=Dendryphion nanum TaxID=256645 RepID=A0A9P9E3X7_9PLEO|nr:hypothetical protein B0J11DRAFT_248402 [Dendryphion nanum]